MPRTSMPDSTVGLLRDGYEFISKRCRRLQTDAFRTRLQLKPTICLRGEHAARLFYDEGHFTRVSAAPRRAQATLLGRGGVQGLDGAAHRHRKRTFMALMSPERIEHLLELTAEQWRSCAEKWERKRRVVLLEETEELLFRAVTAWCGVPVADDEVPGRTRDLAALIDAGARLGPRHWEGRLARRRCERWLAERIEQLRQRRWHAPEDSAARLFAEFLDLDGSPLDPRTAAVELLNVIRPTVAVARYVVFAAHAMHAHRELLPRLKEDDGYVEWFVQEVRRFYPFFPFAVARVRSTFEWRGMRFPAGVRVLLDLYGTNHDPRLWDAPDAFRPERFDGWRGNPYTLVPQGGADPFTQHRCAGEWLTLALLRQAVRVLARGLSYRVPRQDLRIRLSRIPALPESGLVLKRVRRKEPRAFFELPPLPPEVGEQPAAF